VVHFIVRGAREIRHFVIFYLNFEVQICQEKLEKVKVSQILENHLLSEK